MMARVRVPKYPIALGGWRGQLEIAGDVLQVVGDDPANRLKVDCGQVKRFSFNSNSGLWAFRMKDGKKVYLQTSGLLMSADRTEAGSAATESIAELLAKHGVPGLLG